MACLIAQVEEAAAGGDGYMMQTMRQRHFRRWLTLFSSLSLFIYGYALAAREGSVSSAVRQVDVILPGLQAPADIVVDHWGIAHIFAATEQDAFFAQGYNAARDRLWQIDLWRKRGLGLLAKSFGPAYVAQDRASRLFLFRGDMQAEWAAYGPAAKSWVGAFVEGVNAFVAEVRAGRSALPIEFKLTDTQPEVWQPEDVLRIRTSALVANVVSEVARAQVVCAAGVAADRLRHTLEPPGHVLKIPAGLNPCDVPAEVLGDYVLATKAVDFAALQSGHTEAAGVVPAAWQLTDANDAAIEEGSNNWVVAPNRTATGRPILANDPHRQLGVPSLRYIVALSAPGLNVIGAGEPALPGVTFGHNEAVAFGLTIFAIDQEDLYVYALKPGDSESYRYRGRWEKMRRIEDAIEVRGESARSVVLRYTRHGPVLLSDPAGLKAFALRTAWNEPGVSGYSGALRLLKTSNWQEFKTALGAWGAPALNFVYADVHGNIGWAAAGRTPVRKNWDGLLPVPGDGRYEWQGFYTREDLPAQYNPAAGFLATANEMNLPAGFPAESKRIAFEWTDRSRIDRIDEVLRANDKVTLADSMALQLDTVSTQSRRAVALLDPVNSQQPMVAQALALLRAWNHDENTASAAAAIYEVWATKYLGKAVVGRVTPEAARKWVGSGHLQAVIEYLEHPDAVLGTLPVARNTLLLESLTAALAELQQQLGTDMAQWSWGRLHHATFEPAVAGLADPALKAQMRLGPLQTPGGSSTPRAQSYRGSDFAVTAGASVRLVMDVGAWDESVAVNSPGQSADPMNAHYRDLFPLWAGSGYVPLRFTRAAVNTEAEQILHLQPAPPH